MRVLLQRVTAGSVSVDGDVVGQIGPGLVILIGVGEKDTGAAVYELARKVVHLRIFNDEEGKFNHSLLDVGGDVLVVSQFTLYADTRKGRRPSFSTAANPGHAANLINHYVMLLRQLGVKHVATGQFGAAMKVSIENDGPVTIWLDSDDL